MIDTRVTEIVGIEIEMNLGITKPFFETWKSSLGKSSFHPMIEFYSPILAMSTADDSVGESE